jgi:hypothetical protein
VSNVRGGLSASLLSESGSLIMTTSATSGIGLLTLSFGQGLEGLESVQLLCAVCSQEVQIKAVLDLEDVE